MPKMIFVNPSSDDTHSVSTEWAWALTFVFGWIYLAIKRCWIPAILLFAVTVIAMVEMDSTVGYAILHFTTHLLAAFLAKDWIVSAYERRGWTVKGSDEMTPNAVERRTSTKDK